MITTMKILITGDRNWTDWWTIWKVLGWMPSGTIVVHGNARGADRIGGRIAAMVYDFVVRPYSARWNEYGKAAGVIRNQEMLDKEGPFNLVLAFHPDLRASKGTKDMVLRARAAGCVVWWFEGTSFRGIPISMDIPRDLTKGGG